MTSNSRIHPAVADLQQAYGAIGFEPLPLPQLNEWAQRFQDIPDLDKRTVAAHVAVLANRLLRMDVKGAEHTVAQLLAITALVLEDVTAAMQTFAQSGMDATTLQGAAEKIGGSAVKFDPNKSGAPAGAGGLLGLLGGQTKSDK